jgi:hypothetical protein
MKIKIILLSSLLILSQAGVAQEEPRPEIQPVRFFIGLQPGLTIVPFDEYRSAFDVNLIPLTIKYALNRHWSLRIHSIWDLEIRPENFPAVLSTVGVEVAAHYHLALKNNEEGHRGFYVAPVLTPSYNRLNQYYEFGLGAEAGFNFLFGYKWSLGVSAQAGTRLQVDPDNPYVRIIPYSIPVIILGIWL